jgi:hypothetical protein
MTIELRQLIIRAVVTTAPQPDVAAVNEAELVSRCTRMVLRQLERLKER